MKKLIASLSTIILFTGAVIAQQSVQQQPHSDKKASTKGEKHSMTQKHTPADTKKADNKKTSTQTK